MQIVWLVSFFNFSTIIVRTFFFADNKTVELQSHKNINCKSRRSNNTIVLYYVVYILHHSITIRLTLSPPCVSFLFCSLLLLAVDERFLFPFHNNDNNDEYRRDLRTYFLEDPHGIDDDHLEKQQKGSGHSSGLVSAVLLCRSSVEFD